MPTLDPNHPEWKGFVASMRDEPANDAIRLAFADWLEDRNGPAFAGFIRAMVEVARHDPTNLLGVNGWEDRVFPGQSRWDLYAATERHFRSCWGMWSPINKLSEDAKKEWRFHRGFPDKVVLDWRGLKWLDTLCAIGPVGEVEVVHGSPVTADFHSHTVCFYLNDFKLEQRIGSGSFVVPNIEVPVGRRMYQAATERFLEMIWGGRVQRIWYGDRPNVQVWPVIKGQGVLLPHQDPWVISQTHHTEE